MACKDSNAGTIAAPFKSLAKVSAVGVDVGDKIFLHRGQTHTGRRTVAAGVTVNADHSGAMPTITGGNGGVCVDVPGDGAVIMNIRATHAAPSASCSAEPTSSCCKSPPGTTRPRACRPPRRAVAASGPRRDRCWPAE